MKGDWKKTAKDIKYKNGAIQCFLMDKKGNWKYNELEIPGILKNVRIENDNGFLTFCPNKDEESYIMSNLFPMYKGKTKTIEVSECYMLSVNIEKYNKMREETLKKIQNYKLPKLNIFFGYSNKNYEKSLLSYFIKKGASRPELASAMLEIFYIFLNNFPRGEYWMWYFEDDIIPINIKDNENLKKIYNVPEDAEMIRVFNGVNKKYIPNKAQYRYSWGGGLLHAILISNIACQKILNYASKHKWKNVCDIDIFKITKNCKKYPTGYDGWNLSSVGGINYIPNLIKEEDKIIMYDLDTIIFDQKSNPLVIK